MNRPAQIIPFEPQEKSAETPSETRSDDELMLLARGGVHRAFEQIVLRHQSRGFKIATKYLGDPGLAQDATQNAFVRIFRALAQYHPNGKFQAYFHRVLINECKMIHRSCLRRRRRNYEFYAVDLDEPQKLSDDQILQREKSKEIYAAISQLSDKLRAPLILRFAGDCSYQEIADTLNIPAGTVKSRIFSGIAKLRSLLDEEDNATI